MPKPPPPSQPDSGITPLRSGPAGTYTESGWHTAAFRRAKDIFHSEENETRKGRLTEELLTANKKPLGWYILIRPQVVHFNRPVRSAFAQEAEVDTVQTANEVEITFLGHGTLMLKYNEKLIHIDPYT